MGHDPPGDDASASYDADLDRPLVCSNPSSYASRPSRDGTLSSRGTSHEDIDASEHRSEDSRRSEGSHHSDHSDGTEVYSYEDSQAGSEGGSSAAYVASEASSMKLSRQHQLKSSLTSDRGTERAHEGDNYRAADTEGVLPMGRGISPKSPRIRLRRATPQEEQLRMVPDSMPFGAAALRLSSGSRNDEAILNGAEELLRRSNLTTDPEDDGYVASPGEDVDMPLEPGFRRTLTARAAFHEERYGDPVQSVIGRRGSIEGHEEASIDPSLLTRRPGEDYRVAEVREAKAVGAGNNMPLIYWANDPPVDEHDTDRLVDGAVVGQQLALLKMKQKSMHSDQDGSGNTEGLTDDHYSDSDVDIGEETYRQLPPARICNEPYNKEEVPVPEQRMVRRGMDPEEITGEEDRLVVRRSGSDGKEGEDKMVAHDSHGSSGSKKVDQMVLRKPDKVYPKEKAAQGALVKADPKHDRQLAFAPEPLTDLSERYNGYRHCFITIEEEHRFLMLYTFLKRNLSSKVIIFFSTTKSTQYYSRLLQRLKFDARAIHNGQSKEKFMDEFMEFSKSKEGILCVPDFQGSDLAIPPTCDWIVQYEPPGDPSEYIFRVGRISSENGPRRGSEHSNDTACRALLFLTPAQFSFLKYYKAARVRVYEYEIPRISNVQKELEKLLREDAKLGKFALEAYRAYLMAYASHDYRDVYNVHELDQRRVARCFGFEKVPSRDAAKEDAGKEEKEPPRESPRAKEGWGARGAGGVQLKDPSSRTREKNRWRPQKTEPTCWMKGEKSWKHADLHADKLKVKASGKGKPNPEDYKPRSVKLR